MYHNLYVVSVIYYINARKVHTLSYCTAVSYLHRSIIVSIIVVCNKGSYQYKNYAQESIHQSPGVLLKYTYPVCELCPKGTFQSDKAAPECHSCPQHHSTVGRGSASVEDCQGIKYYFNFY